MAHRVGDGRCVEHACASKTPAITSSRPAQSSRAEDLGGVWDWFILVSLEERGDGQRPQRHSKLPASSVSVAPVFSMTCFG